MGEVSPDTAFEIIRRFVEEYLGQEYEAVLAVHDNTAHVHGHIIFNSVNPFSAIKPRNSSKDSACMTQASTSLRIISRQMNFPSRNSFQYEFLRRTKLTGIQKTYYARVCRLRHLERLPYSKAWEYREEIRKMQEVHEKYLFLVKNGIHWAMAWDSSPHPLFA